MKTHLLSFITLFFGGIIFKNEKNEILNLTNLDFEITENDIMEDIFHNQS